MHMFVYTCIICLLGPETSLVRACWQHYFPRTTVFPANQVISREPHYFPRTKSFPAN